MGVVGGLLCEGNSGSMYLVSFCSIFVVGCCENWMLSVVWLMLVCCYLLSSLISLLWLVCSV